MRNLVERLFVQNLPIYDEGLAPYTLGVGSLPTSENQPLEVRLYRGQLSTSAVSEVELVEIGQSGWSGVDCPIQWPVWLIANGREYGTHDDFLAGLQATLPAGVVAQFAPDQCKIQLTHPRDWVPPTNIPVSLASPEIIQVPLVSSIGGDAVPCPIDFADWTFPGKATTGEADLVDQINESGVLGALHSALEVECESGDAVVTVTCFPGTTSPPGNIEMDPIAAGTKRLQVLIAQTSARIACDAGLSTACQGLYYPSNSTTTYSSEIALAAAIAAATTATDVTLLCIDGYLYAEGDFETETDIRVGVRSEKRVYQYTGADQAPSIPAWAKCAQIKCWSGESMLGSGLVSGSWSTNIRAFPAYVQGSVPVDEIGIIRVGRGGATGSSQYGAGSTGPRYVRGGSPSGIYSPSGQAVLLAGNPRRELIAVSGSGQLSKGEAFAITRSLPGYSAITNDDEWYSDGDLFGPLSGTRHITQGSGALVSAWIQIDLAVPVEANRLFIGILHVADATSMRVGVAGGTAQIGDYTLTAPYGPVDTTNATATPISYTPSTGAIGRPAGAKNHRGLLISSGAVTTVTRLRFSFNLATQDRFSIHIGEAIPIDGLANPSGYYGEPSIAQSVSGSIGSADAPNASDPDYAPAQSGQGTRNGLIVIDFSANQC